LKAKLVTEDFGKILAKSPQLSFQFVSFEKVKAELQECRFLLVNLAAKPAVTCKLFARDVCNPK